MFQLLEEIITGLESGNTMGVMFMHFMKVFNRVYHQILLENLEIVDFRELPSKFIPFANI